MKFNLGDKVGYKSVITDTEYHHVGEIRALVPDGIPSCSKPMVMITGKAGVVLESHCTLISPLSAASSGPSEAKREKEG